MRYLFGFALAFIFFFGGQARAEVDWSKTPVSEAVLFYPGVASWEFLKSDDHRLGGREITRQGKKDCRHCHLGKMGDLDLKADEIISGTLQMKRSHKPFEPEPMHGRAGVVKIKAQAAYDSQFLYVRFEWPSNGAAWHRKKTADSKPDRITLQVNRSSKPFQKYGCFITCHDDVHTMPSSPSKRDVASNPYYKALGRDTVRLYAYYARNSWESPKGDKELDKLIKEGNLIDLWSMEFEEGKARVTDGWILDDRRWEDTPAISGNGSWANGRYTAVFKARLNSRGPRAAAFSEGEAVTVGISMHDNGGFERKHHVSFPLTIGIGTGGDIKALKTGQ